jgi:LAO/AO transport system kinase
VGVGQTELGIVEVADTVVVAVMPESGDTIQTLKAGVMEIADIYLVNKADREGAAQMSAAITAMLHTAAAHPAWIPPVLLTSATSGQGIEELWSKIQEHRGFLTATSELTKRRGIQRQREFLETIQEELGRRLTSLVEHHPVLIGMLDKIARREAEPYSKALEFLDSDQFPADWLGALQPRGN